MSDNDINVESPVQLETPEGISEYIPARLRGDTASAPPSVNTYHGIEQVEDLLIAWFRRGTTTRQQREWFWDAVAHAAAQAWDRRDADTLERIGLLAGHLERPDRPAGVLPVDPDSASELSWGDKDIGRSAALLNVLHRWDLKPDPVFWSETFSAIVGKIGRSFESDLAIQRSLEPLDTIEEKLWRSLFLCSMNAEPFPEDVLYQVLASRWQRCQGNPEQEQKLLGVFGAARAETKYRDEKQFVRNSARFRALTTDWLALQWTPETDELRKRLELENAESRDGKGISPRRFSSQTDRLGAAARL